ncbi:STN domain-containing protein, partial [Proteiniphilum sp. UBA1028]|uniref:STN domain-containing protein n=1 Tax=Proteiniphilum sp. UBA1028 TaxID=1947251 RepID=UPI0025E34E12
MKDSLFIKKRETNNPYYSLRKLGILVFFVSVLGLNVSAMVNLSDARINLMFEDVPIKDVFSEIEKQSDHIFMFSGDLKKEISKKITVHVNSASLSEILDIVTHGTDLKYRILDKQIVIYKSDTA